MTSAAVGMGAWATTCEEKRCDVAGCRRAGGGGIDGRDTARGGKIET